MKTSHILPALAILSYVAAAPTPIPREEKRDGADVAATAVYFDYYGSTDSADQKKDEVKVKRDGADVAATAVYFDYYGSTDSADQKEEVKKEEKRDGADVAATAVYFDYYGSTDGTKEGKKEK